MARRIANASGDMNSTTLWDTGTNTPTFHATTNIANSTSGKFTATFTAPNTTNACTGVILYTAGSITGTITVTLQQNSVDTGATATIASAKLNGAGFYYFRFATPYTFTTTTSGAYRFKIASTGSSGNWAADSGGTLVAFLATDDRTGALGATDDLYILGHRYDATPLTVTVTGTNTTGSGTETTTPTNNINARSWGYGVVIGGAGTVLKADDTASSTWTQTGQIIPMLEGELRYGNAASPIPVGVTAKLLMVNTVGGTYCISNWSSSTTVGSTSGKIITQGTVLTNWKAKYVSGSGVAADPFITTGDIGSVGDEIAIAPTTKGQYAEKRFIITKNSSTSYVLSSTVGGVEAALTNTHVAGAHIVNVQRSVVFGSASSITYQILNYTTNTGYFNMQWTRIETSGSISVASYAACTGTADYCVLYENAGQGWTFTTSKVALTYTGLINVNTSVPSSTNASYVFTSNCNNKTFNDCFVFGRRRNAVGVTAFNIAFNRLVLAGCNNDNNSTSSAFLFSTSGSINLNDCDFYANNVAEFRVTATSDSVVSNSRLGVLSASPISVDLATDTYNTLLLSNCSIGDTDIINGYLNLIPGSHIDYENLNGTTYNNISYTQNGALRAAGTGLADTTVRSGTTGEHSVRLDSETTDGRSLTFDITATPNEAVLVTGYIWENATFVADGSASVIAELYLPGKTVGVDAPDATKTMTKTTNSSSTDASFTLSTFYSGTVYDVATLRIRAITTTAGAYVYVGSINQGGNPATQFNVWRDGRPIDFMPEAIGDSQTIAAAVWNYLKTQANTTGTFGKAVNDIDGNAELAAIT